MTDVKFIEYLTELQEMIQGDSEILASRGELVAQEYAETLAEEIQEEIGKRTWKMESSKS